MWKTSFVLSSKAALKSLELDEMMPEAHMMMGVLRASGFDWQGAECEFGRALELDPKSEDVWINYDYSCLYPCDAWMRPLPRPNCVGITRRDPRAGEEIEIRKRKRVIGRLVPGRPRTSSYPGLAAPAHKIFGEKVMPVTGAELVSWGRGE